MEANYFIIKRIPCQACRGTGWQDPAAPGISAAYINAEGVTVQVTTGSPPCPACAGYAWVRVEVPLLEALHELGVRLR